MNRATNSLGVIEIPSQNELHTTTSYNVLAFGALSKSADNMLANIKSFRVFSADTDEEAQVLLPNCDALICRPASGKKVHDKLLAEVRRPFVCATFSRGTNNIELQNRNGIHVIHAEKGGNLPSVTEWTVSNTIELHRRFSRGAEMLRNGHANVAHLGAAPGLQGKRCLLIGGGKMALDLAPALLSFKTQLRVYSPSMNQDKAQDFISACPTGMAIECTNEVEPSVAWADVVILTLPLNHSTRGLIDKGFINRMKAGSVIVNPSRGGLVKEDDVVDALKRGHLSGYAADVINEQAETSNSTSDSPLWETFISHPELNLVLTPHMAGSSDQALEAIAAEVLGKLERWLLEFSELLAPSVAS